MQTTELCGHLLVGGFAGPSLPASYERALREGRRAGAILFRRNVPDDVLAVGALTASIAASCTHPPIVAVDQEGGRVARLGPPLGKLPPMLRLAASGDGDRLEAIARAQADQLAALGFTTSLAPVLDVLTNPENPVIGDRAFSVDPQEAGSRAVRWARGLRAGGVFPCGKHFPGHGDTALDSHFALPRVAHDRARLEAAELVPFRAAIAAGIESLMTAHVVYDALDPKTPATLSRAICTDLLRRELGFSGVLLCDDLGMKALAAPVEETAIAAVRAGCDVLLVCAADERAAEAAYEALVREAERDPSFHARCTEAAARSLALRRRFPPHGEADRSELSLRIESAREAMERLGAFADAAPLAHDPTAPTEAS